MSFFWPEISRGELAEGQEGQRPSAEKTPTQYRQNTDVIPTSQIQGEPAHGKL
ncbi:MAG: hypothetical protein RLN94_06155 [Roseovarius sp.]|uniref:hypothetical protein n=1 Tax=Roseovarius sp. TaxID=1486281 RepID=UPI0032EAA86E